MTLTTPYSATFHVGDGETKEFPYLFEEVSESFIDVVVYNSLTGLTSIPTYIVDTDQKQVIFGDDTPAPTADETVCIYRNTPNVQDVAFRTLHGYDAKTLENILSKIVAMIQEIKSNYFTTQVLQGDPWQLDLLTSADDGATVNIDYTAKKLVKGLYFKITDGNLQVSADGSNYITMPKSVDVAEFRQFSITLEDLSVIKKLQYRVGNEWFDAETNAQATADEALALAQTVQSGLSSHVSDLNNPHQTSLVKLTDTNIVNPANGQFMMFDGLKWKNVNSSATASWGTILGNIADQTDLKDALDSKVNIDGSSIMTAPLKFRAGSMRGAVGPYLNGVSFWKLDSQGNITNIANLTDSQFLPVTTNAIDLGRSANKWKDLYLGGKAYVATINNGADLSVPNKSGTLATTADVELAARSGRMLTDQGVWYAKMYSATVAPSAEDDTNYADFSQVDSDNNPIIVIYTRTSGAWVQSEIITPPSDYDGYVPVTSKIWDIAEQSGQQGGRVLWNHTSKEFTPYPTIISFEDIEVTGESTVIMPENPTGNQIVNKDYVDTHAGTSSYHPDLFDFKWADHTLNDVQWLRADTFSWQSGSVYEAAFNDLFNDIYISTSWRATGYANVYTASPTPEAGDTVYSDSACTTSVGTVTSYDSDNNQMSYNSVTWDYNSNSYVTPVSETVAGYSVDVYTGHSGKKIVSWQDESDVASIYSATGVAWYYIIDIANKRFKLPRTRHAFTGLRDTVGKYVQPGLPNITGELGMGNNDFALSNGSNTTATGAFAKKTNSYSSRYLQSTTATGTNIGFDFDSSRSSSIYGNSTTVQPPATQMYLYFYVGEFTQTAIENTAGITAETLNDKVDKGHQVIAFQAPTSANNYTWYRKYADGWVEQGGQNSGSLVVSLPVTMADANYQTMINSIYNNSSAAIYSDLGYVATRTTTSFTKGGNAQAFNWVVYGMAA